MLATDAAAAQARPQPQPAFSYPVDSNAPSTQSNTMTHPTPLGGSESGTPAPQQPQQPFKIKLGGRRVIVEDDDDSESE
jgi:hypothetical protein